MPLFLREFDPSEEEIESATAGPLHERAVKGFELFNARRYWDAHEALEEAWLEEPGTIRALYKGILQAGVMLLHIERENLIGALKMYKRCQVWLTPWPDEVRGIDVGQFKADRDKAIREAMKLGEDHLAEFDPSLYFEIHWQ